MSRHLEVLLASGARLVSINSLLAHRVVQAAHRGNSLSQGPLCVQVVLQACTRRIQGHQFASIAAPESFQHSALHLVVAAMLGSIKTRQDPQVASDARLELFSLVWVLFLFWNAQVAELGRFLPLQVRLRVRAAAQVYFNRARAPRRAQAVLRVTISLHKRRHLAHRALKEAFSFPRVLHNVIIALQGCTPLLARQVVQSAQRVFIRPPLEQIFVLLVQTALICLFRVPPLRQAAPHARPEHTHRAVLYAAQIATPESIRRLRASQHAYSAQQGNTV